MPELGLGVSGCGAFPVRVAQLLAVVADQLGVGLGLRRCRATAVSLLGFALCIRVGCIGMSRAALGRSNRRQSDACGVGPKSTDRFVHQAAVVQCHEIVDVLVSHAALLPARIDILVGLVYFRLDVTVEDAEAGEENREGQLVVV